MNKIFRKQTEEEQTARKTIMEVGYLLLAVFLILTLILAGFPGSTTSTSARIGFFVQGFVALLSLVSFIFSRRGNPMIGAYFLPSGLLLLTVFFLNYSGINGNSNAMFFITTIVIASVTVGIRGTVLFAALSIVTAIGLYFGQINGLLTAKTDVSYISLIAILAHILGNSVVLISLIRTFDKNLHRAQENEKLQLEANRELREFQVNLEQRVADRTRDLQIASDVSRQITQILKLEDLLPRLVEKTKSGFDLYFVSVFLFERETRQLVLEAGTGEAGRIMKVEGMAYSIDAVPSLVAQAGRDRQAVIIKDASQSDAFFAISHLPDTRSEVAIPMIVQGELIGVLDLQSKDTGQFTEADLQILTTLAEQIAVAIENARLYEEQVNVTEQLRTVNRMKSQFLSSMSHELRTPLNAIINFVEMVVSGLVGPVTEEQKELLEYSLNSSTHLLHLINDVLDISKIQAGKLTLFLEQDVNLYCELEAALEMVAPMFNGKPVQLVKDIVDNLPVITGDKRRIRQILINLLSNAVKFTDRGSVTLSAKYVGDEVVFAVIDTGLGITLEAQSVIFEAFVQTLDGIKLDQGTGLGLPISRSLVQAHGGELWVESQPGKGSTFYFTLPVNEKA